MNQQHGSHEEHTDELTLMLIADGEPVSREALAHVDACAACAARLADLRAEAAALSSALALDVDDLRFLQEAALPQRAVASYTPADTPAFEPFPATSFLLLIGATAIALVGWLVVAPLLIAGWEYARRLGLTALLAHLIAGWLYTLITALASAVQILVSFPLLEGSLIVLAAMAALTWLLLVYTQRRDARPFVL